MKYSYNLMSVVVVSNFYILIFFSETTGLIGTNLGRTVHGMVLYTVYVSFVDQKYTRKQEVSKRVFPLYIGINYL